MPRTPPRFEILEGLPPYGPRALPFPADGRESYREGYVVRFFPGTGEPWVGNFQPGGSSFSTVKPHPDGCRLVVISRGQGYIVEPEDPGHVEETGVWYSGALEVRGLLILNTPIDFEALAPDGRLWRTTRVSWDGFRDVEVDASAAVIKGEAWSPLENRWIPFEVELNSGKVRGGSYQGL